MSPTEFFRFSSSSFMLWRSSGRRGLFIIYVHNIVNLQLPTTSRQRPHHKCIREQTSKLFFRTRYLEWYFILHWFIFFIFLHPHTGRLYLVFVFMICVGLGLFWLVRDPFIFFSLPGPCFHFLLSRTGCVFAENKTFYSNILSVLLRSS